MDPKTFPAPLEATFDGLTLRCYRPGDGAALREATVESYEHLRPWMPWARAEQSVDEAELLCRRFCAHYLDNTDYTLGIWEGAQLAGGCGYHLREGPLEWRNAEVGMWVRASYAGRGVGTRALAGLLRWGFGTWGWQRLSWRCDTRNRASARVAEKNGFRLEGTLRSDAFDVQGMRRDTHIYAILRDEWIEQSQQ